MTAAILAIVLSVFTSLSDGQNMDVKQLIYCFKFDQFYCVCWRILVSTPLNSLRVLPYCISGECTILNAHSCQILIGFYAHKSLVNQVWTAALRYPVVTICSIKQKSSQNNLKQIFHNDYTSIKTSLLMKRWFCFIDHSDNQSFFSLSL